MNFTKVFRAAAPSLTTLVATLLLPLLLGTYFIFTRTSQHFITQENISFWDVRNNYWAQIFVGQDWLYWFDRIMNYAWWGLGGALLYIIVWGVASSRIIVHNHFAEEEFVNFKVPRGSWHSHFAVEAVLKLALLVVFLVGVANILVRAIPFLAEAANNVVLSITRHSLIQLGWAILAMAILQAACLTALKVFRMIQFD